MPRRADGFIEGKIYHALSKSIAGFKIFNSEYDYNRMLLTLRYYQQERICGLSRYLELNKNAPGGAMSPNDIETNHESKLVEIIAYCLMPTHFHLALKQLQTGGIQIFIMNCLNSYSHYFNLKYKRKGPLWEGRFKAVSVESDEQLLHLTRYIHLNPVTAFLVDSPEFWYPSSYGEYLATKKRPANYKICHWEDEIDIEPGVYKKFVLDRIAYQRELANIKNLMLEENHV